VRRRKSKAAGASVVAHGFTLAWVCLQGAFGALTVTMKLFPAIVTLHLLGGLVLLALLCVQAVTLPRRPTGRCPIAAARRPARLARRHRVLTVAADRARRLGQHQLRGAGLPAVPHAARAAGGRR
jgi:heme A synthase